MSSTKAASNTTTPTQFLQVNGHSYAYRRFGNGSGLPLLCRGSASPPWLTPRSCLRELDDHLDVSRLTLESLHKTLGRFAPRDEPTEPRAIRSRQHLRRLVPVSSVRVHATNDDVILEDHGGGHISGEARRAASAADAREADDSAARGHVEAVGDDLADAGALDDDVGVEADIRRAPGVVRRPQGANELGLGARHGAVQHVHVQAVLPTDQRRQQADRPAPVTSTLLGSQKARCPTACTCSQALVTTVVGSSSTPRRPSERSTFMVYSGSIRHLSDMKPSICLMPRSVYWPLRHMSHSPTAQLGQGTGSGRRTMPTTKSPSCKPPVGPGSSTRPSDSCPSTKRALPGGAHP
jgi:hypothetical protein